MNKRVLDGELCRGISVFPQRLARELDANPEALNVTQYFHGLGQMGVAIVNHARSAEILLSDPPERPAWVLNLNPVVEPRDANRRVGRFISAVHYGVSGKLVERGERIVRLANLHWPRRHVNRRLNVGLELLIQAADDLAEWAINVLRVLDRITQGRSINAQELNVGVRNEVACQFAQNEATRDGGNGLVNTLDHPAGGQPLLVGAVVLLQDIGGEGARQIILFKQPSVQVFELGMLNRMKIKRQVPMPPLLVQSKVGTAKKLTRLCVASARQGAEMGRRRTEPER